MRMRTVVTGAAGFLGSNLVVALRRAQVEVVEIDVDTPVGAWVEALREASVVFHLAGVNRPQHADEFVAGNVGSLSTLFAALDTVAPAGAALPRPAIVLSSSAQAAHDNPYGRSKLRREAALEGYARRTGTAAAIYRLPGVFGKWCRPNYNSVVATFCHNIARDLPITIADPARRSSSCTATMSSAQFMSHLGASAGGVVRREVTARLHDHRGRPRGADPRVSRHAGDASRPGSRPIR